MSQLGLTKVFKFPILTTVKLAKILRNTIRHVQLPLFDCTFLYLALKHLLMVHTFPSDMSLYVFLLKVQVHTFMEYFSFGDLN